MQIRGIRNQGHDGRGRPRRLVLGAVIVTALLVPASWVRAQTSLADNVDQAVTILERFRDIPEKSIPDRILADARGVAIMTVLKAGFIFSGQGGLGLVVARTRKGWSGPSAIGTGGAGFGFQVGAQVTEYVLVLNTEEAVRAFSRGGNVTLGADVSVAAGPVGRTLGAAVTPVAAVYTYSRSQGLFAGISLEGTVIATRDNANRDYYGRAVTAEQILSGAVKAPPSADRLRRALAAF